MKNNRLNYYLSILIIFMIFVITACKEECTTKDTIVENKLTPEVLTFFRYDSFDTINCLIDSQEHLTIYSETKTDRINTAKEYQNYDCGTGIFYYNHQRIVEYFDSNKLILRADLKLTNQNFLMINFDFYNTTIVERNYTIGMFSYSIPDTSTIDGQFYSDLYYKFDENRNYKLYYSKSFGLVKIISNGKPVFQLQR